MLIEEHANKRLSIYRTHITANMSTHNGHNRQKMDLHITGMLNKWQFEAKHVS